MERFKKGDRVAAPVCVVFPNRRGARSRFGYDIGTVVAVGKNKKTGKPAVKVRVLVSESIWAKRISNDPEFEKWCLAADCDRV